MTAMFYRSLLCVFMLGLIAVSAQAQNFLCVSQGATYTPSVASGAGNAYWADAGGELTDGLLTVGAGTLWDIHYVGFDGIDGGLLEITLDLGEDKSDLYQFKVFAYKQYASGINLFDSVSVQTKPAAGDFTTATATLAWDPVRDTVDDCAYEVSLTTAAPITARYVKFVIQANASQGWLFLGELQALTPAPIPDNLSNLAGGASYTPSVASGAGNPYWADAGGELTDDLLTTAPGTLWDIHYVGFDGIDGQVLEIVVDLGKDYADLYQFKAYTYQDTASGINLPDGLTVQTKAAGGEYTAAPGALTWEPTPGSVNDAAYQLTWTSPLALTARYVKFVVQAKASQGWLFFSELQALGVAPPAPIPPLANIAQGSTYEANFPFGGGDWADAGGELTDGWYAQAEGSLWDNTPGFVGFADIDDETLELVVDLGQVESDIYQFIAWLYRETASGINLPQTMSISTKINEADAFVPVEGEITWEPSLNSINDAGYQLVCSLEAPISARYVKFSIDTQVTQGWMFLSELWVMVPAPNKANNCWSLY